MTQSFEMLSPAAKTKLETALTKAESQLQSAQKAKFKSGEDDEKLSKKLLPSTGPLVTGLRNDFKAGKYTAMAASIKAWQTTNAESITAVKGLVTKGRLTLTALVILIDHIDEVRKAAKQ